MNYSNWVSKKKKKSLIHVSINVAYECIKYAHIIRCTRFQYISALSSKSYKIVYLNPYPQICNVL
jgi:hypothetical protein